jgi:hypothetical protein
MPRESLRPRLGLRAPLDPAARPSSTHSPTGTPGIRSASYCPLIAAWVILASSCASHIPVHVTVSDQATSDQDATVTQAVEQWNAHARELLSQEVFVFDGLSEEPSVTFAEQLPSRGGCAVPRSMGCADLGGDHLWVSWERILPQHRLALLQHEMGHLLGLVDRDDQHPGIMQMSQNREAEARAWSEWDAADLKTLEP